MAPDAEPRGPSLISLVRSDGSQPGVEVSDLATPADSCFLLVVQKWKRAQPKLADGDIPPAVGGCITQESTSVRSGPAPRSRRLSHSLGGRDTGISPSPCGLVGAAQFLSTTRRRYWMTAHSRHSRVPYCRSEMSLRRARLIEGYN